ncbi:LysR substrate-binding domain-containing protein [Solimonas marina]|uniref:LysR family transcriptional regulator n=1 Tax=Solimonas marina TaxID=2714601 RepID=A0A970B7U7_9GAMM|nr:LysR substrate-binding domain-containing protein [Solimonas marina]NKF24278.1 LysR family transcriptional regulator [Solimonas marina]
MLDLNQLRCFVTVAEELHFSRAAERLHMTQPPLSRQIQLLEHAIGAALFVRNNRVVRLTPAGRTLLPEARTILRLAENASLSARRVSRGEAGVVSVGFTAAAGYEFLPGAIARWREEAPDIELRLKEMVSGQQLEALDAGRLDFGLLRPPVTRDGMRSKRVVRETLVAAFPANHPLASSESLTLKSFDRQPFVMYAPDEARYFYDLVARIFSRVDVNPLYGQHVSQVHSVLALVRAGLGVALVPHAATSLRYEGIIFRDVAGLSPARPVELYLVWKEDNDNPALPHFLAGIGGD